MEGDGEGREDGGGTLIKGSYPLSLDSNVISNSLQNFEIFLVHQI